MTVRVMNFYSSYIIITIYLTVSPYSPRTARRLGVIVLLTDPRK